MPWLPEKNELLWIASTVSKEIEEINGLTGENLVDKFLPRWREYINDITTFIDGHSRIFAKRGNELLSSVPVTDLACKLDDIDISLGVDVMRLVDLVDLIRHPSMRKFIVKGQDKHGNEKEISLSHEYLFKWLHVLLSNITGSRIKTTIIRVMKEASRFTNVLMNQAIATLNNHGFYPLRMFTTGIVAFAKESDIKKFYNDDGTLNGDKVSMLMAEIGELFSGKVIDFLTREKNMKNLYNITSQGIKLAEFVYQKPDASRKMRVVMEYLARKITPVKHDPEDLEKSSRFNAASKLNNNLSDELKSNPVFAEWEGGMNTSLMVNDAAWRLGRYVNTAFITVPYMFKTWKKKKINQVALMKELLETIGIFSRLKSVYDKPDNLANVYRYYFSHIIGKAIVDEGKTMDDIKEPLIQWLIGKLDECDIKETFMEDPSSFVSDHLQLFTAPVSSKMLVQPSDTSSNITCGCCGKNMKEKRTKKETEKAYKWKSQFVAPGVPVDKSSNFLVAGMRAKAARMICDSCKWRHYLDVILATVSGKNLSSWYCSFYSRDGLPFDAIKSLQQQVQRLKDLGTDADTSFRVIPVNGKVECKVQKGYGFMLPSIPDEICGSFTIDWKIKKNPVNEQFWDVLEQVLVIATRTRMRCVVTKLRNDYEDVLTGNKDIVFQDLPQDFKWLLGGKNWLTFDDANMVLDIMSKVHSITKQIVLKDMQKHNSEIVKRMKNDDPLPAIHYIENAWNSDRKKKNYFARSRYFNNIKEISTMQHQVSRS
jgi:hypothetical protein